MKRLAEFKEVYTDIRDLIYSIALIEYGEDNNKYRGYKFEKLEKLDTDKMYFMLKMPRRGESMRFHLRQQIWANHYT